MECIDLRRIMLEKLAARRVERVQMQRRVIYILAILVFLLAVAGAFLFLRSQPRHVPITIQTPDENVVEPYHQEMDCVDRLLENNNLNANEVQPALARCRSDAVGNQSQGQ